MSRIGKKPIEIPQGVEIKIEEGEVMVKGALGELIQQVPAELKISLQENTILVIPQKKTKKTPALWGLWRSLIFNMVRGVSQGFEKKLEIEGVGYRAVVQGDKLVLSLGLSHPIEISAPADIKFEVVKNQITVSGIDKQLVGQVAAKIRAQKKPEPYKGKGIRYLGEKVRRKAGKKAVGSS